MPSDATSWDTKKELSFLKELASSDILEFGRSRQGRNKIVNCEQALAGYAAAFESRANWHKVDRQAIREWLTQYRCRPTAQRPLHDQSAILDEQYAVQNNAAVNSLASELEHQLSIEIDRVNSENHVLDCLSQVSNSQA